MKKTASSASSSGKFHFFDDPEERSALIDIVGHDSEATLIIGHPGTGKSTLASTWPDPYFLSADNKIASLPDSIKAKTRTFKHGEAVYGNTLAILDELKDIENVKKLGIKTVVLDTVTAYCSYMETEIIQTPDLNPKGIEGLQLQHYNIMGLRLTEIIHVCKEIGLDLVMLSHVDEIVDEDGEVINHPNVTGKKLEMRLAGMFDHVIYTTVEKEKYISRIKSSLKYPHAKIATSPVINRSRVDKVANLTYNKLRLILKGKAGKKPEPKK